MSSNMIAAKAEKVITTVLGGSAYLFVDLLDEEEITNIQYERWHGVFLSFDGYSKGNLSLWAEEGLFQYAAANMLGVDTDNPEAARQGVDAIKELLNIIVGNLLTELYGVQPVFELGLPQVTQGQKVSDALKEMVTARLWFRVDEYYMVVLISVS